MWSSARERELTKLYNAELRARHDGTAGVRCCRITITFWQHLTCSPADGPGAALPPGDATVPRPAPVARPEHAASRERQAPMAALEMRSKAGRHRTQSPSKDSGRPDTATLTLITPGPAGRDPREWAQAWLRNAMAALAVLAAAAAVVSWDAQYVMVRQVKHIPVIAALEAGIPDVGALIFAALGIALALHGRRALRPRTLNVACVGLSLAMNAMAAGPGLAGHGHLGHARRRLRPGQRHPHRRRPRLGAGPHAAPPARRSPGRRSHPARRRRRPASSGCCAWPWPRQHADRVPPLGRRGMPRRPRPQSHHAQPPAPPAAPPPQSRPAARRPHRPRPERQARQARPADRPGQPAPRPAPPSR